MKDREDNGYLDPKECASRLAGMLRDKGDEVMLKSTTVVSNASAQTLYYTVLGILGVLVFLFLNVTLGLAVGEWLELSPSGGMLCLSLFYILLLVVWMLCRRYTISRVRSSLALKGLSLVRTIDEKIDEVAPELLRRRPSQRQELLRSLDRRGGYAHVVSLSERAKFRAIQASARLSLDWYYIKKNPSRFLVGVAKSKLADFLDNNAFLGKMLSALGINAYALRHPKRKKVKSSGYSLVDLLFSLAKSIGMALVMDRLKWFVLRFFGLGKNKEVVLAKKVNRGGLVGSLWRLLGRKK